MESNVRSYPPQTTATSRSFKAQGIWVTDVEGNDYLDCLAGAGTLARSQSPSRQTSLI